jgi:hypothetical protein
MCATLVVPAIVLPCAFSRPQSSAYEKCLTGWRTKSSGKTR